MIIVVAPREVRLGLVGAALRGYVDNAEFHIVEQVVPELWAQNWIHVAMTWDGSVIRFYVNGQERSHPSRSGTLTARTSPLFVGCNSSDGTSCPAGGSGATLDDVGIWNRVLSTEEIAELAQASVTGGDGIGQVCDACTMSNDASCQPTTCLDEDGDGYGQQGASDCPGGLRRFDCDDKNPTAHPGGIEACDGVDNDCDGQIDESCLTSPAASIYEHNAFNQLMESGRAVTCAANDSDCDGVPDATDNCPSAFNPEQKRSDTLDLAQTNPVGLWRFEDAQGSSVITDSTGRFNGTPVNGPIASVPGRDAEAGQALSFNGNAQYLTVPSTMSPLLSQAITVEAWVSSNTVASSYYRGIVTEAYGADAIRQFEMGLDGSNNHLMAGMYSFSSGGRLLART